MPFIAIFVVPNPQAISTNTLVSPPAKNGVINEGFLTQPTVLPKKDFVSHTNFPFCPGFGKGEGLLDPIPNVGSRRQLGPLKNGVKR